MKTTFKEEDNKLVMTFEGRLDTPSSAKVKKEMEVLYHCEGRDVVLDCTALEYICSSGLRLFLAVLKNARQKGSRAILAGLNNQMYDVFEETGFTQLFELQ